MNSSVWAISMLISTAIEFSCSFVTILWGHSVHDFEKVIYHLRQLKILLGIDIERSFPLRFWWEMQQRRISEYVEKEGIWVEGDRLLSFHFICSISLCT